ncbi:MAG: glutaredoxin family protein [Bacillales bacterium]|nr:glutaredoxin family protein [Bacillales bacterium]
MEEIPIVEFYTKPGCHLCEEALHDIKKIEQVVRMRLHEYNIDEEDALTEEFGIMIPVIKINGELVQYGNVDMNIVKRVLLRKDV